MKKVRIVATIGPATENPAMLEKIFRAGVNVCRLNFSFGTHEEHLRKIKMIRAAAKKAGTPVAILQDLQGPKIRVGKLKEPVTIKKGDIVTLTGKTVHKETLVFPTTYKQIASDCKPGKIILIADGKIILKVESADPKRDEVKCSVMTGGQILSGKGINLPYTRISLPAITEKDEQDAIFGIKAGVDFMGMSFVRTAEDVRKLKNIFKKHDADIPIIAKIEKPEALDNIDEILDEVAGIMVARGDLAVELSFAKVPAAQKMLIHKANSRGKLTITATEMLSSMIVNPLPTRADVSDVANAIWDGTDAVMLSNESAVGNFPLEAVKAMAEIAVETESAKNVFRHDVSSIELLDLPAATRQSDALCKAVAALSHDVRERGIAALATTGETVKLLSKYRPDTTIFAVTACEKLYNKMAFYHNVLPIKANCPAEKLDGDMLSGILLKEKLVKPGDELICLYGIRDASDGKKWHPQSVSLIRV